MISVVATLPAAILVVPDASVCLHVPIQDRLTGEASLTDHTLILLTFIVHALNVPSQRTSLSELVPALRALVPPLPTVHCTFVYLHIAALNEPLPARVTAIRFLSCMGAEVAPVMTNGISVVVTLPAAIFSSCSHRVHVPPVLLQRGGRRQSHLTHVTAIAAA